jgi:hypothetical protein
VRFLFRVLLFLLSLIRCRRLIPEERSRCLPDLFLLCLVLISCACSIPLPGAARPFPCFPAMAAPPSCSARALVFPLNSPLLLQTPSLLDRRSSHGAPLLDCPSSPRSARAPSRCPSAPSARLANFCLDPPQPRPWPPARISPEPEQSSVHDRRRVPDARSAEWLPRASSLSPRLAPSPNSHGARPAISISLTVPCSLLHELSRVLCRAELVPDPCLPRSCAPSPCCSLCACGPLPPARSRFLGSPWSLRGRFCPVRVPLARPRGTSYMAAVRRRVPRVPTRAPSPCVAFHSPKPEFASRPCLPVCCYSSSDLAHGVDLHNLCSAISFAGCRFFYSLWSSRRPSLSELASSPTDRRVP